MKEVFILGAGGHAKVVVDILLSYDDVNILGILDADENKIGNNILDIEVIGTDKILDSFTPQKIFLVNAIGSTAIPKKRAEIYKKFKSMGYKFFSVVHKSACIARDVEIGEGAQIMAGAVIQSGCKIGTNAIVNTVASIDHDGRIGDNSHLAPGVICSGNVTVGNNTHVGVGAVIIQNIDVGDNCLVAAGSVVTKNIMAGSFVMGVPAKKVDKDA
ncbi:MAG: acetyltransferase [Gammaproteobacteria bacterium]|jgi:UDP-perosamine 4-acetyltransferase